MADSIDYTHDYMKKVLDEAYEGHYALPAINISNLDTAIAAMDGLQKAGSPGFVQITIGSAKQASPDGDPVKGTLILARMLKALRAQYTVPIFIHTDHCHAKYVDVWLRPLLNELIAINESTGERIFDSFMFDGSMAEIHENARVISELVPLVKKLDATIEVEAGGAWGGSEDGVGGGAKYSTPDDVRVIQQAMHEQGLNDDDYLLAVAFGNAHGTAVVPNLKPELLDEISVITGEHNHYVFHGGSGSPDEDVRAAVKNGVVKMNVDTDTQYAYTHAVKKFLDSAPIDEDAVNALTEKERETIQRKLERAAEREDFVSALHALKPISTVVTSHKHGKKYFDPRDWNKAGREGMVHHVVEVAHLLGSAGKAGNR